MSEDNREISVANNTKKVRRLRQPQTVRERADKASVSAAKPQRRALRKTAGTAARPFRALGRLLTRIFRPFRFLFWPFKTRVGRFIGRVLAAVFFLRFIRNSAREVRTVTWPGRRETIRLTFAVFIFALTFGALIALTDYGLDKVFKKLLLK
jgi:preprotein translocase SecE subunit